MRVAFKTQYGTSYNGMVEDIFRLPKFEKYQGKVDLIFFSPPFPLNRKKKYGNKLGEEYLNWFSDLAIPLTRLLSDTGSIVIEMGNSWEPKKPQMSTLSLKSLISFLEKGDLKLCEQFVWFNPAKLPSPAQWVNIERIRVKDAFTHIWWMSKKENPKANNRNIVEEYSAAMQRLLKNEKYNSGLRPSEHSIGDFSFLENNNGAIPSNVLVGANTDSNSAYMKYCRKKKITPHPARMPRQIPEFFIKFLTDKNDLVIDPFAGSNTTGAAAESFKRRWISVEPNSEYISASKGRFIGKLK